MPCNFYATLDICYDPGDSLVDLVSLIEERLPRYTLRADAITSFTGYDNADWIVSTPCFPVDYNLDLSPELIEETLKYFSKFININCGSGVFIGKIIAYTR